MLKAEDPSGERPLWHSPMWQKGLSQELTGLRQPANKLKWRATTELLKSALRQKDPIRLLRRMALSSRATDLKESVEENEQWTNVKSQEKLIIQDNLKKDLGEQRAESAESTLKPSSDKAPGTSRKEKPLSWLWQARSKSQAHKGYTRNGRKMESSHKGRTASAWEKPRKKIWGREALHWL